MHTMQPTKTAFRLSITREERPQGDLYEQATGSYAYPAAWASQGSRRSAGNWCRLRDESPVMRGEWSCDSCWMPRHSPVGTPSASGAGRWALGVAT